jgi:hypothetical protein
MKKKSKNFYLFSTAVLARQHRVRLRSGEARGHAAAGLQACAQPAAGLHVSTEGRSGTVPCSFVVVQNVCRKPKC